MLSLDDPTTGSIIIAIVVGVFGLLNIVVQKKIGKEVKTTSAKVTEDVKAEAKSATEKATHASTTHAELLLAKHDQVLEKLCRLDDTVEKNRKQNQREHLENSRRIDKLFVNQESLFELIAEVDRKVSK